VLLLPALALLVILILRALTAISVKA